MHQPRPQKRDRECRYWVQQDTVRVCIHGVDIRATLDNRYECGGIPGMNPILEPHKILSKFLFIHDIGFRHPHYFHPPSLHRWRSITAPKKRRVSAVAEMVDMEEVDEPWLPCLRIKVARGYDLGNAIGKRFQGMIRSRFASDPVLHSELLPFAATEDGENLVAALTAANRKQFPAYFDELRGTADGAEVPFLQVLLINMRKEIAPFLPTPRQRENVGEADQCSTILLNTESLAVIAHNEDADISLLNHAYLVHAELEDGLSFMAYTYAAELPSCAFGFNNHGVVFTLNAVPLAPEEAVAGGICRNFISRDLLEASNRLDALKRVCLLNRAVGHNYNIMDIYEGKMITVEAASKGRWSIREIGAEPFFHANMYIHLHVTQVANETSLQRQRCADRYTKLSRDDMMRLLGDATDEPYPVYMQGPKLVTLCTVVFDLHALTFTLFQGNPQKHIVYTQLPLVFPICSMNFDFSSC